MKVASERSNIDDQGMVHCAPDRIQYLKWLALDHPLDSSGSMRDKGHFKALA